MYWFLSCGVSCKATYDTTAQPCFNGTDSFYCEAFIKCNTEFTPTIEKIENWQSVPEKCMMRKICLKYASVQYCHRDDAPNENGETFSCPSHCVDCSNRACPNPEGTGPCIIISSNQFLTGMYEI